MATTKQAVAAPKVATTPAAAVAAPAFAPFAELQPPPPAQLAGIRPEGQGPEIDGFAPVALFPVRIETRFASTDSGNELWVRVYPDQIEIDGHKPDLTAGEWSAGNAYWAAVWNALQPPGADPQGPWRSLAGRYGSPRAAWIALLTWPWGNSPMPAQASYPAPTPPQVAAAPGPNDPPTPTQANPTSIARLMPSQWTVYLYDSKGSPPTGYLFNNPVQQNLLVGPDLSAAAQTGAITSGGMLWMTDFDEAVRVGMAARVPLSSAQASGGLARVVVLGLVDPAQGSPKDLLERLLHAHHYDDGLAIVRRGSDTKNTESKASAVSSKDLGYSNSYKTEQGAPLATSVPYAVSDGQSLAGYLGVDPEVFAHVAGSNGTNQQNAQDMARVLSPATLTYLLRHLAKWTGAQVEPFERYFINYVAGRGPIPPIRVGSVPYGILPVTSVGSWQRETRTASQVVAAIVPLLKNASPVWLSSALASTPYVGKTNDPDSDLLGILGMNPSPVAYSASWTLGPDYVWNLMQWYGVSGSSATQVMGLLDNPFGALADAMWGPQAVMEDVRLMGMGFQPGLFPITPPTVQDDPNTPLSDSLKLVRNIPGPTGSGSERNYLDWLGSAIVSDIQSENYPAPPKPTALLYKLVRQAVLNVAADVAGDAAVATATPVGGRVLTAADLPEQEFVRMGPNTATPSRWEILSAPIPGVPTVSASISSFLDPVDPEYGESLSRLSDLSTAELDRLMGETLDTMSTRLDAWMTSVATVGLMDEKGNPIPPAAIGCYGWVEKLSPAAEVTGELTAPERTAVSVVDVQVPPSRTARLQPVAPPAADNGGFIFAPSLPQATTAAILREGYLTHQQASNGTQLAIDLSSDRVRMALRILQAIRDGELFGAVLGARFERNLQAGNASAQYVPAFRDQYPLNPNKPTQTNPPPDPSEAAAPSVVDGAALQQAWFANAIPWGTDGLPAGPGSGPGSVKAALDDLNDVVDALGDVSLAEGVFQILRGNPDRAGGILDSLNQGQTPPEVQVLATPRAGTTVAHRLLIMGPGDTPVPSWDSGFGQPRAMAEPWLHSWLTGMLPAPSKAHCSVTYNAGQSIDVTLEMLDVGPLDMITFLSSKDDSKNNALMAELEQRVLYYAFYQRNPPLPSDAENLKVDFTLSATALAGSLTFPQYMFLVEAARDFVAGCRALTPSDLVVPVAGASTDNEAAADADSLAGLASTAEGQLGQVLTELEAAMVDLLDALTGAAGAGNRGVLLNALTTKMFNASWFGFPGSIPPPPGSPTPSVATATLASQPSSAVPPVPTFVVQFDLRPEDKVSGGTDTLTLWWPAGATFPAGAGAYSVNGAAATVAGSGANFVQITFPSDLPGLSTVQVTITNLVFPAGVAPSVGLATSGGTVLGTPSDPVLECADMLDRARTLRAAVSSRLAGIAGSVTNTTLTATPAKGSATSDLDIEFKTSPNGRLSAKAGTVTIVAPSGTVFPSSQSQYSLTIGAVQQQVLAVPVVDGSAVTVTVPLELPADTDVELTISGVNTPPAGTYLFSIRTSADAVAALLGAPVALAGAGNPPTSVSLLAVPSSSPQAGLSVSFKTSLNGKLAKDVGTITIVGTTGLRFSPQAGDYNIQAPGYPAGGTSPTRAPLVGDGVVVLAVPLPIGGLTTVSVTLENFTSLQGGTYSLSVATSADTGLVPVSFTLPLRVLEFVSNLQQIFGRSFTVVPHYTPTNAQELVMGLGDTGRILGPGTIIPETWFHQLVQVRPAASRLDLLAGLASVASGTPAPTFSVAQLPYRPHDAWLGGKSPPQVSAVSVSVSPGAAGATYTIKFETSPQGQIPAGKSITLVGPPGTTWPSVLNAYQVQSQSGGIATLQTPSVSSVMGSTTNNQVVLTLQVATVGAGDVVAIQATGVQGPTPGDGYSLIVYTSTDDVGVASSPFSIAGSSSLQPPPAPPARDRVALVFLAWPGFQASAALGGGANPQPVAGLVADSWSERIPSQLGTAGLVFHHDEPWSQAPQAILLAVNPQATDVWGDGDPIDALRAIIEATIDLLKIRTVDVPGLTTWGQVIPPLFVPYNPSNDTVCTFLYSPAALVLASKPPSNAAMM